MNRSTAYVIHARLVTVICVIMVVRFLLSIYVVCPSL